MLKKNYAGLAVSISELKRNPQAVIDQAHGEALALLNRNKRPAYIIPAETYEMLMEMAEDIEMAGFIEQRKSEKPNSIEMNLDDL